MRKDLEDRLIRFASEIMSLEQNVKMNSVLAYDLIQESTQHFSGNLIEK